MVDTSKHMDAQILNLAGARLHRSSAEVQEVCADRLQEGNTECDDVWERLEQRLLDQVADDAAPTTSRMQYIHGQGGSLGDQIEEVYVVNSDKGVAVLHQPNNQVLP
jgi:hypothetical protein